MEYIYGPIKSRRLGVSLGISLVTRKACSFDCIYCQLGKTTDKTAERKEYIPIDKILEEIKLWIRGNPAEARKLDYMTFSGYGEPTLNINFGQLIIKIKELLPVRVAVITNSTFLNDPSVRKELLSADLIVPSLDAVEQEIFEKIDAPAAGINVEEIISGLIALRKEFPGKIWLEIMLVEGVNDSIVHVRKLKQTAERINPDKIQLNSPIRKTKEQDISCLALEKLREIKEIFGDKCEII